jgi:thiamine pyrophosphokinase
MTNKYVIVANGHFIAQALINKITKDKNIIALDGAVTKLLAINIIPHILIGDFDSVTLEAMNAIKKSNLNIEIIHVENQDRTDLQKAITYCDNVGAEKIEIICATGLDRMDHTLGNIRILRANHIPDRPLFIHTDFETIRYLKNQSCKIHGMPGDKCGVLAFPEGNFSSTGLKWNGDNYPLQFAYSEGTCNELIAPTAEITVNGEAIITAPLGSVDDWC